MKALHSAQQNEVPIDASQVEQLQEVHDEIWICVP